MELIFILAVQAVALAVMFIDRNTTTTQLPAQPAARRPRPCQLNPTPPIPSSR